MAEAKNPEILVIELVDRKPSDFVLEGSEEQGMPVVLDGPGARRIVPTSHYVDDKGVYRKIRFIKGANTIDFDEQEERNIRPNPQMDNIWIPSCTLTLVNREPDKMMFKFVREAAYNEDAPNRPPGYPAIYREIKAQEIAKDDLENKELRQNAMDIVLAMREKVPGGYEYDLERIDFLSTLFGVLGQDSPAEKLLALSSVAESRPKYFLETVASRTREVRVDILSARQFAVLSLDGDRASFMSSQHAFFEFKSKDDTERVNELVHYFLSEKGALHYKNLVIELQAAKNAAV